MGYPYCLVTDEKIQPLSWDMRVQIALDVARGLEYLHDGVSFTFSALRFSFVTIYVH